MTTNERLDIAFPSSCLLCGKPIKRAERTSMAWPCPHCGFEQCGPEAKLVQKYKPISV